MEGRSIRGRTVTREVLDANISIGEHAIRWVVEEEAGKT